MNRLGDNATAVGGRSSCRFELDSAAPWGAVDSRAIDWTSYGIADFDFDPLFKRGERQAAIDGLDLKDAVKLVQPIEETALRGSILRAKAPDGGWASCFKRILDRIEGRCGMILRIPCIPLSSGINDALCYSHG